MKRMMFVSLAACLSLSSEQNWVELPDGYEWESPPPGQRKFALSTISTDLLSNSLQEAIGLHWSGPELPKRLEIFEVDLNGDGRREVFVSVPELGGTGGGSYMILSPSGNAFRYVGAVLGFGFEFLEAKKGWKPIKGVSRGGGGQRTRFLLGYNGTEYQHLRIENHDLVKKTVTIRIPERE